METIGLFDQHCNQIKSGKQIQVSPALVSSALAQRVDSGFPGTGTIENPATVTRMTLNLENPISFQMILPLVAYHSVNNHQRWVTWVTTSFLNREMLSSYGVNPASLRIIVEPEENYSPLRLVCSALSNGRSNLVVARMAKLHQNELEKLEESAVYGNTSLLILEHLDC
jgi:cell division inhibitor SulA